MKKTCLSHALLLFFISCAANAGDTPANWKCKWCQEDQGKSGHVSIGAGILHEADAKFTDYRGPDSNGLYLEAEGDFRYRGEEARYFDAKVANLGLDSRSVEMDGGKQGHYDVRLIYHEIPHYSSDSTKTPFLSSRNALYLPADWVPARRVEGMSTLPGALHEVKLETNRNRLELDLAWHFRPDWKLKADFMHEKKNGNKALGNSFAFNRTVLLAVPVDYETDEMGMALTYNGKRLQLEAGWQSSFFDDRQGSVIWQNPFAFPDEPTEYGQFSLTPDNEYHRLYASAGWAITPATRFAAHLSDGVMRQDERFLPYTINPSLHVQALPRESLGGEVHTRRAKLSLTSRYSAKLHLSADYTYSDRDNRSPRDTYAYVITDVLPSATLRTNSPYSFTQHLTHLKAAYRLSKKTKVSGGFIYNTMARDYQAVEDTRDKTLWGKLNLRLRDNLDMVLEHAYSNRDNSNYHIAQNITPIQNPLLRLFTLAERKRRKTGISIAYRPHPQWNLGFSADYYQDDYPDSAIGLQKSEDLSLSFEASWTPKKHLSTHAHYTWESIRSTQSGSQSVAELDWRAKDRYANYTLGVGAKWVKVTDKLDLGADIVYSRFNGKITYENAENYADLRNLLWNIDLHATYKLKKDLTLRLSYMHEHYDENDLFTEVSSSIGLPTVVGLGEEPDEYDDDLLSLSVKYSF